MNCNRCGRSHSGPCGIPRHSTMRNPTLKPSSTVRSYAINTKETIKVPKQSTKVLEDLLGRGKSEEAKCIELLKVLPPSSPEYLELMEKLDKVQNVLRQINVQLFSKG
jgi:hypothetical protein